MKMQRMAFASWSAAVLLLAIAPAGAAEGSSPCTFKWDVSREVALFAGEPRHVSVSQRVDEVPVIATGQLYAVQLAPEETVRYAVPASKKRIADGAFGGMLRLKVSRAGLYRISIDSGFWLDIASQGRALPAADFNGSQTCSGPRKIVVYELPADVDLLLQMGNATLAQVKLSVTAIDAAN